MPHTTDYQTWLAHGSWIRVSARAIIFNHANDHILVEQNDWIQYPFFNFIGGGVELNETLHECIARELAEETDAQITASRYLFVVENFFLHQDKTMHSLEHYFQIKLDRAEITPQSDGIAYQWLPIHRLAATDLRPTIVRDSIVDGTYTRTTHMVLRTATPPNQ